MTRSLLLYLLVFAPLAAQSAEPLVIRTVDAREVRPLEDKLVKGCVLFFVAKDCPISNSLLPEMNRIAEKYGRAGIAPFLVYADGSMNSEASQHSSDYLVRMPVAADAKLRIAARVGARITPEAVLLDPNGEVVYRGRIDDTFAALGKRRTKPTARDLREALDAFVAGQPVRVKETAAVGCFIPFPK